LGIRRTFLYYAKTITPTKMARTITFVAFGNSLTTGFQSPSLDSTWQKATPYSNFLREIIDNYLKHLRKSNILKVIIRNKGISGEFTSDMVFRFKRDIINLNPNYVVILGGSNDIGLGIPTRKIFANLIIMFKGAIDNGIEPIVCTVPSILGDFDSIQPRLELNHLIIRYCHNAKIRCVDIFTKTCDPKTKRLHEEYSNDGLHMNTIGYRNMAETIFNEAVKEILLIEVNKVEPIKRP